MLNNEENIELELPFQEVVFPSDSPLQFIGISADAPISEDSSFCISFRVAIRTNFQILFLENYLPKGEDLIAGSNCFFYLWPMDEFTQTAVIQRVTDIIAGIRSINTATNPDMNNLFSLTSEQAFYELVANMYRYINMPNIGFKVREEKPPTFDNPLVNAVIEYDIDLVEQLLFDGDDANSTCSYGFSLLNHALSNLSDPAKTLELVKLLLLYGADPTYSSRGDAQTGEEWAATLAYVDGDQQPDHDLIELINKIIRLFKVPNKKLPLCFPNEVKSHPTIALIDKGNARINERTAPNNNYQNIQIFTSKGAVHTYLTTLQGKKLQATTKQVTQLSPNECNALWEIFKIRFSLNSSRNLDKADAEKKLQDYFYSEITENSKGYPRFMTLLSCAGMILGFSSFEIHFFDKKIINYVRLSYCLPVTSKDFPLAMAMSYIRNGSALQQIYPNHEVLTFFEAATLDGLYALYRLAGPTFKTNLVSRSLDEKLLNIIKHIYTPSELDQVQRLNGGLQKKEDLDLLQKTEHREPEFPTYADLIGTQYRKRQSREGHAQLIVFGHSEKQQEKALRAGLALKMKPYEGSLRFFAGPFDRLVEHTLQLTFPRLEIKDKSSVKLMKDKSSVKQMCKL